MAIQDCIGCGNALPKKFMDSYLIGLKAYNLTRIFILANSLCVSKVKVSARQLICVGLSELSLLTCVPKSHGLDEVQHSASFQPSLPVCLTHSFGTENINWKF